MGEPAGPRGGARAAALLRAQHRRGRGDCGGSLAPGAGPLLRDLWHRDLPAGYEAAAEFGDGAIEGGYADLVAASAGPPSAETPHGKYDDALRRGVTPFLVLPDVFVPEGHPHFEYNGIREEVVAAIRSRGHYSVAGSKGSPGTAPLPQG